MRLLSRLDALVCTAKLLPPCIAQRRLSYSECQSDWSQVAQLSITGMARTVAYRLCMQKQVFTAGK